MNYRGNYQRAPLKVCPKCGMDSGVRKMRETVPEQFFVKCESCGHITRPHPTQAAASLEWNHASKKKTNPKAELDYAKRNYVPSTLCEVCAKACGGCSWSRKGVQQPVEGWDAIRHDLNYAEGVYSQGKKNFYNESYIVLHCPEFELEPHNEWAFEKFDPEGVRAIMARRRRGHDKPKTIKERMIELDQGSAEKIPND